MTDAVRTGGAGLWQEMTRLDAAAARVARFGTDLPGADAVDPAVEVGNLIAARAGVEANAAVARTASEAQRRILDIRV